MSNKPAVYSLDPRTFVDPDFIGYRNRDRLIERRIDDDDGIVPGDLLVSVMVQNGNRTRSPMKAEFNVDPLNGGPSVRVPVLPAGNGIGTSIGNAFKGIVETIIVPPRDMKRPGKPVTIEFHLMDPVPVETEAVYAYYRNGHGVIVESKKIIREDDHLMVFYRDFHFSSIPKEIFFTLPLLPSSETYVPKTERGDWNRPYRQMDPGTRQRLLGQVRGLMETKR
ncbi:MAG: hypothetical protein HGA31_05480 [Candidatus Moranbacteria bacterium]|nr:hypothetical protein [Candidatus Moranbacteria bacterium]